MWCWVLGSRAEFLQANGLVQACFSQQNLKGKSLSIIRFDSALGDGVFVAFNRIQFLRQSSTSIAPICYSLYPHHEFFGSVQVPGLAAQLRDNN